MKSVHWFAGALALCVGACNFTPEGQCYLRGDSEGAGVGGGVGVIASGAGPGGGLGDSPSTGSASIPCNASNNKSDNGNGAGTDAGPVGFACNPGMVLSDGTVFSFCASGCNDPVCITFGSFSSAAFHFKTIVADDGKDEGGGWQEADETLKFVRWTNVLPEYWTCHVNVGMAIRTKADGVIAPSYAAAITAAAATQVSQNIKDAIPDIQPGIFCSKLVPGMQATLKALYSSFGILVKS
jgi:hypothetical protein